MSGKDVVDELCEDFDVALSEDDVFTALRNCSNDYRNFGREMLITIWEKVIRDYEDVLDINKFNYDVSSPSYPDFYYDDEIVSCRADLDELINKNK